MGVLYIKKKILAILMVGLFVATVFGTLSVSAEINTKQVNIPYFPTGINNTGSIAVKVYSTYFVETDDVPRKNYIDDATVTCIDSNGVTHEMLYEELVAGDFFYIAYDLPVGPCEITASKDDLSTTITVQIESEHFDRFEIELEETPISRFAFDHPLLLRILQAFQILFHLF